MVIFVKLWCSGENSRPGGWMFEAEIRWSLDLLCWNSMKQMGYWYVLFIRNVPTVLQNNWKADQTISANIILRHAKMEHGCWSSLLVITRLERKTIPQWRSCLGPISILCGDQEQLLHKLTRGRGISLILLPCTQNPPDQLVARGLFGK